MQQSGYVPYEESLSSSSATNVREIGRLRQTNPFPAFLCACVHYLSRIRSMQQSGYVPYEESLSSSSATNTTCARLASSSPPESFANSYRLPLAARASSRSPRPAVLIVSDEIPVEDVQPPAPIAINSPLPAKSVSSRDPRAADGGDSVRVSPVLARQDNRADRIGTLVLAVSLLVLGGLVLPVSCVALLGQDEGAGTGSPAQHLHGQRHTQKCYSIRTRLQFAIIGQGLVLSLTGVLLAGCWSRDANLDQEYNRKYKVHKRPGSMSLSVSVSVVVSFTVVLVSLCFIVWELMSSSIYCTWSPSEYAMLSLLELVVALMSAVSTGVVAMLTLHRK